MSEMKGCHTSELDTTGNVPKLLRDSRLSEKAMPRAEYFRKTWEVTGCSLQWFRMEGRGERESLRTLHI